MTLVMTLAVLIALLSLTLTIVSARHRRQAAQAQAAQARRERERQFLEETLIWDVPAAPAALVSASRRLTWMGSRTHAALTSRTHEGG